MTVSLVVAVAANGVIGRDGDLPWRLPDDLAHFKRLTLGGVLVMGRATYDSIGRPLPGRSTVVVTGQAGWSAPGVRVAHSVPDALSLAASLAAQVYVVGGAAVFAGALGLADRLVVSHVRAAPAGDTYLPDVDWPSWQETEREPYDEFDVVTYERVGRAPAAPADPGPANMSGPDV
ncbi:MAG: dihydrofolate reductase [Actinomycetota bacterium]|nr:dihydrofolate reductase [Actinomycetota bacterium]